MRAGRMVLGIRGGWWPWCEGWRGGWSGRGMWCGAVGVWLLFTAHLTILIRRPPHPALTQPCYHHNTSTSALHPHNMCCRLHNYTKSDVVTCVRRATNMGLHFKRNMREQNQGSKNRKQEDHFYSPNQYFLNFDPKEEWSTTSKASRAEGDLVQPWVWVAVGDSRVRQVFSALLTRLNSPRLKYNKPSTGGKWRSIHELIETLRIGKLHEDIEVYHQDLPFNLTFLWDPQLDRLPLLLQHWIKNPHHQPTLLLLGSGLHWMKAALHSQHSPGDSAGLDKFQQHMNSIRSNLASLATTTHTILQLLDHIQENGIFRKYKGIHSNRIIDLYNTFLQSYTSGTYIIPWDSNIPFSDLYHAQCRLHHRKSYDKRWNCGNTLHTGYIMVEEYANMMLNEVCNGYLGLDSQHIYC